MRITWVLDPSTLPNAGTTTPTQGQGLAKPSGLTTNGCGTLYFINKSNIVVYILFEDGTVSELPAWWARPYAMKIKSNQLWLSMGNSLATTGQPISQLTLESFQPTEDTTGLYSGPINYQTSVGGGSLSGTPATSLDSENQPNPTEFIRAVSTPPLWNSSPLQTWHGGNDGSLTLQSPAASRNGAENNLNVVPGTAVTHGHVELDAAKIKTDGLGGLQVSETTILQTGNQETGQGGGVQNNAAASATGFCVNFKHNMTNVPSSITLAALSTNNESGPTAQNITIYGFFLVWTVPVAGSTKYIAEYTTVGN